MTHSSASELHVQRIPQTHPFNHASLKAIFTTLQRQFLSFLTQNLVVGSRERKRQNRPPPAVLFSHCDGSVSLAFFSDSPSLL